MHDKVGFVAEVKGPEELVGADGEVGLEEPFQNASSGKRTMR